MQGVSAQTLLAQASTEGTIDSLFPTAIILAIPLGSRHAASEVESRPTRVFVHVVERPLKHATSNLVNHLYNIEVTYESCAVVSDAAATAVVATMLEKESMANLSVAEW